MSALQLAGLVAGAVCVYLLSAVAVGVWRFRADPRRDLELAAVEGLLLPPLAPLVFPVLGVIMLVMAGVKWGARRKGKE